MSITLRDLRIACKGFTEDMKGRLSLSNLKRFKAILKGFKWASIALVTWLILWVTLITHIEPTEAKVKADNKDDKTSRT
jgi:hypothetical protein